MKSQTERGDGQKTGGSQPMLRIAICDDEIAARDMLRIQLEKVLVESTEEIVYEFSSGVNAVSWLQKHPGEIDLLFLDVEMDGLNGMETAKKIRAFDKDLSLVFVTGYADYVFDGYHACALDYLLKPVSEQRLRELLHRVREKQAEEETETFFIKNMDGTWRFRLRNILYFYSDRRRVILVTRNSQYPFYAKLDDIESRLSPQFVRIHQRYLVNPANVDHIGKSFVTSGGVDLPCSKRYQETARRQIARTMLFD